MAEEKTIVVHKNRRRAFWSLVIILFMIPVSAWLIFLGLKPGRPEIGWSLVLFGSLGLATFAGSAALVVHTMRAPWHLALSRSHLTLHTPTYRLAIPWERIAGIAVAEVDRRLGCVLVLDDPETVASAAAFHGRSRRPDAVTSPTAMQGRMEDNFRRLGYHLGIPGRILELGPSELAELLTRAKTGRAWPATGVTR